MPPEWVKNGPNKIAQGGDNAREARIVLPWAAMLRPLKGEFFCGPLRPAAELTARTTRHGGNAIGFFARTRFRPITEHWF